MPPSDEDVKDLWSGINDLRDKAAANSATLSRIEALLAERCTIRGKSLEDVETRLRDIEKKLWWMGGAAAVVSSIIGWVSSHVGGGHG